MERELVDETISRHINPYTLAQVMEIEKLEKQTLAEVLNNLV